MASGRDLWSFFKPIEKKIGFRVPPFLSSTLKNVSQAVISMISDEIYLYGQPRRRYITTYQVRG